LVGLLLGATLAFAALTFATFAFVSFLGCAALGFSGFLVGTTLGFGVFFGTTLCFATLAFSVSSGRSSSGTSRRFASVSQTCNGQSEESGDRGQSLQLIHDSYPQNYGECSPTNIR
jgi:hypothetical protein